MLKLATILKKTLGRNRWIQVIILIALLIPISSFSQKVHAVEFANQADGKVFEVAFKNQADLKVHKVDFSNVAQNCSGLWFETDLENQAQWKIFKVDFENQADLKVFYVKIQESGRVEK